MTSFPTKLESVWASGDQQLLIKTVNSGRAFVIKYPQGPGSSFYGKKSQGPQAWGVGVAGANWNCGISEQNIRGHLMCHLYVTFLAS